MESTEAGRPLGLGSTEGLGRVAEALHVAVCDAVSLLNCCPEIGRLAFARDAHTILREALVAYADAYMDAPVSERERAAVAAKHQREPRVTTAAELRQQAKSDTSCVGAFARARPGKA